MVLVDCRSTMNNLAKKRKLTPAEICWVGLGLGVLTTDAFLIRRNCETMSICFGRWVQSSRGRMLCAAGTGAIIAHLFWSVPFPGQTRFRQLVMYGGVNNDENSKTFQQTEMVFNTFPV